MARPIDTDRAVGFLDHRAEQATGKWENVILWFSGRARNRATAEAGRTVGFAAEYCDVGLVDGNRLRRVVQKNAAALATPNTGAALNRTELYVTSK